jgi:hypothetical protein
MAKEPGHLLRPEGQFQIPAAAEPQFLAFNGDIEFHPAMNLEGLKEAAPGIERAKNCR